MVNFMEDNADSEIYSNELKKQAGFGKDGEKGFDNESYHADISVQLRF